MDVLCDNTKRTVMRASFITDRGRNCDILKMISNFAVICIMDIECNIKRCSL